MKSEQNDTEYINEPLDLLMKIVTKAADKYRDKGLGGVAIVTVNTLRRRHFTIVDRQKEEIERLNKVLKEAKSLCQSQTTLFSVIA